MSEATHHPCLHHNPYMNFVEKYLREVAKKGTCNRSRCGSIIVVNNIEVIGEGFNSMPCGEIGRCTKDEVSDKFQSDKTCCVHAEQRAIMDALKRNSEKIPGSTLYFIRLDAFGFMEHAGEPYCTICSKMALDVGVSKFCLYRRQGWTEYGTNWYNKLSFHYGKPYLSL